MGAVRARPEDAGGRHHAAAPHPGRVRARRARDRSGKRAARLTFVIIGAGPTGVELAGTIAEMAHRHAAAAISATSTPARRARRADRGRARACWRAFADDLLGLCAGSLEKIGVEVVLGQPVTECDRDGVVYGGNELKARDQRSGPPACAPAPAAEWLNAPADRAGRCEGRGRSDRARPSRHLCAVGDTVTIDGLGRQAGAGHRAGRQAAGALRRRADQGAHLRQARPAPFRYKHAGSLAQIGKKQARDRFRPDQAARHASPGGSGASPTSTS